MSFYTLNLKGHKEIPEETSAVEDSGCKLTKYFVLLQDTSDSKQQHVPALRGRENAAFALDIVRENGFDPISDHIKSTSRDLPETADSNTTCKNTKNFDKNSNINNCVNHTRNVQNCSCAYYRDSLYSNNSDTGVSSAGTSSDDSCKLRRSRSVGDFPKHTVTAHNINSNKGDGMKDKPCSTTFAICEATHLSDDSYGQATDENYENWRISLEQFTSKRLGERRKSMGFSKPLRSFYKSQDDLINHFEEVRLDVDDAMENAEYVTNLRKRASRFAKITFVLNLVLLAIKVVAVALSGSISLISSLVDSCVDLLSGIVIWVTTRAVKKTDRYVYPQGRTKLEPISIIILSVIMSLASLQIIKESATKIIGLSDGSQAPPVMSYITIGIASATVVLKLILYIACKRVPHPTVQALAQDHRNDVLSNGFAIVFGYIGSQQMQMTTNVAELIYLDPIGALIISIYIIVMWCITGWDQIKLLVGHTATPEFLSKITWICVDHHKRIQKVDTVRAFHFGNHFLVEVDIVLPPEMTLREAHDIGQPLQQKLERLPTVERAFVHIDYEAVHDPTSEHKVV